MAQTTAQAFAELDSRLRLTRAQRGIVESRRRDVEALLRRTFDEDSAVPVVAVTVIGSAGRDTMIQPLDEVDTMATFSAAHGAWEKFRDTSGEVLDQLRAALSEYETEIIGTRGHAVRLVYSSAPDVHIVPVFSYRAGGYALPGPNGDWLVTDPDLHGGLLHRGGEHLPAAVRLLKYWSRLNGSRLRSYHLETFAVQVAGGRTRDLREALYRVFAAGGHGLSVGDPAGHGGDLSDYLSRDERELLTQSFRFAHVHSGQAINAEREGDDQAAMMLWRMVLGPAFPAYG